MCETVVKSETGGCCAIFKRTMFDIKNAQYVINFVQTIVHT
jgi:hypothetical protein